MVSSGNTGEKTPRKTQDTQDRAHTTREEVSRDPTTEGELAESRAPRRPSASEERQHRTETRRDRERERRRVQEEKGASSYSSSTGSGSDISTPAGSEAGDFSLSPSIVPVLNSGAGASADVSDDYLSAIATSPTHAQNLQEQGHRQQQDRLWWAQQPREPLITRVKNEWMTDPKHGQMYGSSASTSAERGEPRWLAMLRAPRIRRAVLGYFTLFMICMVGFSWFEPRMVEYAQVSRSVNRGPESVWGTYGVNLRPYFADMTQMKDLASDLLPGGGKKKRLIFVGDIHGCKDELKSLLDKVSFDKETDHLISTGDMISKGPDSLGVIDTLRDAGASCVRGNHEDRVLLVHRTMRSNMVPLQGPDEQANRTDDNMDEESFNHGDYTHRDLATQLNAAHLSYLSSCPVILRVGSIGSIGDVVVAHAGLVPGVELDNQDPFVVMNMRTVDLETHVPSEDSQGTAWAKLWNRYQKRLPRKDRATIIYGHDAKRGLKLEKYSKGLDSGCSRGGKLSALVVDTDGVSTQPPSRAKRGFGSFFGAGGAGSVQQHLVSVPCKDYRRVGGKSPLSS